MQTTTKQQILMSIFLEFGSISNLRLNMPKTVLIPLWEAPKDRIKKWLSEGYPDWANVEIDWAARYLGFFIGPGKGARSWEKAQKEFTTRIRTWSSLHLGMHMNSRVYRAFCCSVLAFVWQLEAIPAEIYEEEKQAIRKMAPGPGNWIRHDILLCWGLHRCLTRLEFVSACVLQHVVIAMCYPLLFLSASLATCCLHNMMIVPLI